MHTTKTIKNFIENELKLGVSEKGSWHQDYKDSAYIFIGNLNYDLNEGDISTIFSQYGNPVDVLLIRDKRTGKSKGFCFLAYED
jgi:RNA-binding motif X-linked protein 2